MNLSDTWISAMVAALHAKEQVTLPHSVRATAIAVAVGGEMGLNEGQLHALHTGGLLHDIGKISIPNGLLMKSKPLDEVDWRLVRRHPEAGCRLLANSGLPQEVLAVVRHHHERYDGLGYPDGLRGDAIPILARIFALADTLDAMLSARPYRDRRTWREAMREVEQGAGRQFDPTVVEAFLALEARNGICFKTGQKEKAGRIYRISYWYDAGRMYYKSTT